MIEPRKTKQCDMCFEEIHEQAKKCPRCQSRQPSPAWWSVRHALTGTGLAILAFMIVPISLLILANETIVERLRPDDICWYSGEIEVISSQMVFVESPEKPLVCVIGKMRNNSDVTWKDLELEAEFHDKAGELIDVAKVPRFFFMSGIVPRGEAGFKIRAVRDFPEEKYASYNVRVRFATDARNWP